MRSTRCAFALSALSLALAACSSSDAARAPGAVAATPLVATAAAAAASTPAAAAPATKKDEPPAAPPKQYVRGEDLTDVSLLDKIRVSVDGVTLGKDAAPPTPTKGKAEPPLTVWKVAVTVHNDSAQDIDGVGIVAGVYAPRTVDVFASQSESRLFTAPLAAGATRKEIFELRSRGETPQGQFDARVVVTAVPTQKEVDAPKWAPLDPKAVKTRVESTRQTAAATPAPAAPKKATRGGA